MWTEIRCRLPAHGAKLGHCDGLLFRITPLGDLEVKCHRCHKIEIIPRRRVENHHLEYATT